MVGSSDVVIAVKIVGGHVLLVEIEGRGLEALYRWQAGVESPRGKLRCS